MNITINNMLTLTRMLLVPIMIASFYCNELNVHKFGFILFVFACITDLLDGYYARKKNIVSKFGQMIDPLADKLMVLSFILYCVHQNILTNMEVLIAYILIVRELFVTNIRIVAQEKIQSSKLGKLKTLFLDCGIGILLLNESITYQLPILHELGIMLLILGTFLALFSAAPYFKIFYTLINNEK